MASNYSNLSIIIPVYNEQRNVINILNILNNQTIDDFEVIIVDDGSTDKTALIVKNYEPKNFSLIFIQQSNMGAAKAREKAIRHSKSKYVALVDCDDSLNVDSLEKAMMSLQTQKSNIALFNLHYKQSADSDVERTFLYFTNENVIDGMRAFENSISYWGLHAFGIYERELFISAYNIYQNLNTEEYNYLNNDEIISRICFSQARNISFSDGDYFFITNSASTTRRVNANYYNVIHNAFLLHDYILNLDTDKNKKRYIDEVYKLTISTIWGVSIRYFKWRKILSKQERILWCDLITKSAKRVVESSRIEKPNLICKSRIQLYFIRYFI